MVTNVSEKDKTLNEIMAWCDQLSMEIKCTEDVTTDRTYGKLRGLYLVYEHCQNMLGHSGTMPSCFTYEDWDDSSEDNRPQVGDYGVAVRENAHGQEEIPFHIEREEHTGLPVALLNTRLYAKPEDDIDDGQYVSLFQLYLDGFLLSRTGRNAAQDQSEDAKK